MSWSQIFSLSINLDETIIFNDVSYTSNTWYIPGIYTFSPVYTWYIPGIYLVYTKYICTLLTDVDKSLAGPGRHLGLADHSSYSSTVVH